MLRKLLALCGTLAFALTSVTALAARVSPMIVEVAPSGRSSVARIELSNPTQAGFPVEAQMFRGVISEAGELELIPADDQFLVFPAQKIVGPQSQQVFRVQYIGEPELAASEMFYMQIRQIPVEFSGSENQVQVVVNFNVLVNVIPDGAKAEPAFESIQPAIRDDINGIEARVANRGTRYFTAGTVPWQISGNATDGTAMELKLSALEVSKEIGVGVVAPNRTRVFFIPTEKPMAAGTIKVSMEP